MKRALLVLAALASCGCTRGEKLDPRAQKEAHGILSGQTYASEVAGEDILVDEVARRARQGQSAESLLEAARTRQKLTWDPDWLVFRVAARKDFLRPGFAVSGSRRMRALGPLGQVSGDMQELAQAIVTHAPDEQALPIFEFFRGHNLDDFPRPLYFYSIAFFNRDLASENAFSRAVSKPLDFWGGSLTAQGFLRMRPLGSRKASAAQETALTVLQASDPANAAMLYLGWPGPHAKDGMNWSRSELEKGLAALEIRYPGSLYLQTRRLELSEDAAAGKRLGHRRERIANQGPPEAQAWSELPACTVGLEKDQMACPPERGSNLSLQVADLLMRGQYQTLDALFAELRDHHDPRLELAYFGCLGGPETSKGCRLALDGWLQTSSRVAPTIACLPALLEGKKPPLSQAEEAWARGNEDPLANACLVAAKLGAGETWEKQLPTVVTSLKADFLQDRSLEAMLQGSPNLPRAELADKLRQQLGHDGSYCRVVRKDVDPGRWKASLAQIQARPDYSPSWAYDLLFQMARENGRSQASALKSLASNPEYLPAGYHPRIHKMVLEWAAGKSDNPLGGSQFRIGRSHSRYVPYPSLNPKIPDRRRAEPTEGNTVWGESNREFGFDVHFDRPISQDHHWKVQVNHPPGILPEGHHSQCERPLLVTPDDPQVLFVSAGLRYEESILPGQWRLKLLDMDQGGKVIAERSFNVEL
jgi:hypothetical protein